MTDDAVPSQAMRAYDGKRLAPLNLPVQGIDADGLLDLHSEGGAIVLRASLINFGLRTTEEQSALVAAFGRFLNSLHEPIQVLVRSERADLSALVQRVREAAASLPHPSLEAAALAHAAYLAELAPTHDIVRRDAQVVVRSASPGSAADLLRRAGEMSVTLSETGVEAVALDGGQCAATLQRSMAGRSAISAELSAPSEVVRGSGAARS